MKFNEPIYYCTECKTIVPTLGKLLFIEEKSNKGFCSESCIEDFYLPLINHFEALDKKMRKIFGIEAEFILQNKNPGGFIDEVLSSPSEIWKITNELQEEICTYIKHYHDYSAVVICSVYHAKASFIFFSTVTRSREYLAEFRTKDKENLSASMESRSGEEFNEEDLIFMQLLESKKSKLLAELLIKRKDSDISFEDFSLYEYCFQDTLDFPDEVFENKDNEGDSFFIYIKSFMKDNKNFFYIISCLKRKSGEDGQEISVFPVLAFPTNDMDLYYEFRLGNRIAGTLKN